MVVLRNAVTDSSNHLTRWLESGKQMTASTFKAADSIANWIWEAWAKLLPWEWTDRLWRAGVTTVKTWAEWVARYIPWLNYATRYWLWWWLNWVQTIPSIFSWERRNAWKSALRFWGSFIEPFKDLWKWLRDTLVKWKSMYETSATAWKWSTWY